MSSGVKAAMVLAVVLATGSLWGQKMVTPETAMTGNGELEVGYAGGSGSVADSGQNSVYVGLLGSFLGYYQDPRILTFNVAPNWRWDNDSNVDTSFGSNNESVLTSLRFLGGSDLPLTLNYDINRLTTASLTGGEVPITVRSRGLNQNLNVNWSIHKHELNKADFWPTLMLSYGKGWSDNSVSGVEAPTLSSNSETFLAQSLYQIAGFHLTGTFTHQDVTQNNADLLDLGLATHTESKSQSESVAINRTFFKNTSVAASYTTSKGDVDVENAPSNTSFDSGNASVYSNPWKPLSLSGTVNYVSNESGQLLTSLATGSPPPTSGSGSGGVVPQLLLSTGRELDENANATYILSQSWQLLGGATRLQSDLYSGVKLDNDNFFGGVLFSHRVGRGFLSLAYTPGYFTVDEYVTADDAQQQVKVQGLMNAGQVHYVRQIGRWRGNGGFSFSQSNISQPTVVPLVSRSISGNLSASTQIAHEWSFTGTWVTAWSAYAGADNSLSNSVSASIGNRTWNFMGQYQYNSGYAAATPFGLVPTTGTTTGATSFWPPSPPSGGTTDTSSVLSAFYTTADGFAASASYRLRRLQITGTFTHTGANVTGPLQLVNSGTSTVNALAEYRFRRIRIRAGFLRFGENVSGNNGLNQTYNTYYVSLIRPFHVF
jgi:hypothetical protein